MRIVVKTKTTRAMPEAVRIVVRRLAQRFRRLYEKGIFIYSTVLSPSAMPVFNDRYVGTTAASKPTISEKAMSR